ncbi:rhodopsin-like [Macrosteles quadrilineatus]|uniref:rhodopsin-like n=1 Tax=Macrosteles quadrilineatus TaxID=74068 RepID=UPI0023E2DC40|nr:rhodopsin-like [Macrosteles quadrilineatus]
MFVQETNGTEWGYLPEIRPEETNGTEWGYLPEIRPEVHYVETNGTEWGYLPEIRPKETNGTEWGYLPEIRPVVHYVETNGTELGYLPEIRPEVHYVETNGTEWGYLPEIRPEVHYVETNGTELGYLPEIRPVVHYVETNGTEWGYLPEIRPEVHYVVGSLLLAVGTAGVLGNALVLFVFTRFRRLRGPFSSFVVNLAVADLCTSLLHGMAVVSSFKHRWAFGRLGCMLYAGGVGHFGLLSIVTLAAIAVERYWVITAKPLSGSRKLTKYGARKTCVFAWLYCLTMSLPPFFGWSKYEPEGFLTSCSWDYTTRSSANRAYYIYLLTLGFVMPVAVISYCYVFIMVAILAHGREMKDVKANGGGKPRGYISTRPFVHTRSSSTVRTAEIIFVLVLLFIISWTPYAVITFIGQFGPREWLNPWVTALPAFFAKASVVYNPIIYGLSHPHFRSSVKQYISACTTGVSSSTMAGSQRGCPGKRPSVPARDVASSPASIHALHRTHFRCFPRHTVNGEHSFHSEPDPRGMTLLQMERPVVLQWHGVKSGKNRVLTTLNTPNCNILSNTLVITSEGMVTTGSQTSSRIPLSLYDLGAVPKKRPWLKVSKR